MNKKKFMLLSAIAMLGFGVIAPISNTNNVQAATPYVDKDNVLHDYGQKNNGVNLNEPLDSHITRQTTALRQGAWRVYIDPHFSKNDKKELVEAIQAWQKKESMFIAVRTSPRKWPTSLLKSRHKNALSG